MGLLGRILDAAIQNARADSKFATAYSVTGHSSFVVRPDGYLGCAEELADFDGLPAHLRATFG